MGVIKIKSLIGIFLGLFLMADVGYSITLVGYVPGEYVNAGKTTYRLVKMVISRRMIKSIDVISPQEASSISGADVIHLKRPRKRTYDVIYPGLIDLHNHTKQNNLGVWDKALGQFGNRFEWRAWSQYKAAVSQNMNPWIGYGSPMTCAAFRWSELQAMVIGTTYLQGPSSCIKNFTIHQVEDKSSYLVSVKNPAGKNVRKESVKAPTDLIVPNDFVFVKETLIPIMRSKRTSLEGALAYHLNKVCPGYSNLTARSLVSETTIKELSSKKTLSQKCNIRDPKKDEAERLGHKFIRFVYWLFDDVTRMKLTLHHPAKSGVITHLSEGQRNDPYNKIEWELVKAMGLDLPRLNFVHAVGLDGPDFNYMNKKEMGVIWSPFSNLLLYGQTMDIKNAFKAFQNQNGTFNIALGSDWLPTGSRGVLEELKLAKAYLAREGLSRLIGDEDLYRMVTSNPARMLGLWGLGGIGTLKPQAMGTVIVVEKNSANPYTNLVSAGAEDIHLVVIDGKPQYGSASLLDQVDLKYEVLPSYMTSFNNMNLSQIPFLPSKPRPSKAKKTQHLINLAKYAAKMRTSKITNERCKFSEPKGLVTQNSKTKKIVEFYEETGINLDSYDGIHRILGAGLMSQSRNLRGESGGKPEDAPSYFSSLYSCNDPGYISRISGYVRPNGNDELNDNRQKCKSRRAGFSGVPKRMARAYGLTYDHDVCDYR